MVNPVALPALDETGADRVDDDREHDRNGSRRLQQRCHGCGASRSQENVGCERNQFCRVSVNIAGSGPAGIYPQVAVLAPSQLTERLCERREPGLSLSIVRGDIREHADASHTLSLLRPRRERPTRRRAADERDEFAPFHCPAPPVLPTERIAQPRWCRTSAALRDFESADVSSGSGASNWCRSQHFRFTPTSRRRSGHR
jgi:hypothetical protein